MEKSTANPIDAYVALRAKFDAWWAEQAQKEGAFIIPKTLVVDFIRENGKVVGVKTDRAQGDIYAPVVIITEGVNNLLTQKLGLAKHDLKGELRSAGCQAVDLPPCRDHQLPLWPDR